MQNVLEAVAEERRALAVTRGKLAARAAARTSTTDTQTSPAGRLSTRRASVLSPEDKAELAGHESRLAALEARLKSMEEARDAAVQRGSTYKGRLAKTLHHLRRVEKDRNGLLRRWRQMHVESRANNAAQRKQQAADPNADPNASPASGFANSPASAMTPSAVNMSLGSIPSPAYSVISRASSSAVSGAANNASPAPSQSSSRGYQSPAAPASPSSRASSSHGAHVESTPVPARRRGRSRHHGSDRRGRSPAGGARAASTPPTPVREGEASSMSGSTLTAGASATGSPPAHLDFRSPTRKRSQSQAPAKGSRRRSSSLRSAQSHRFAVRPHEVSQHPPKWVPDKQFRRCTECMEGFTFFVRKHVRAPESWPRCATRSWHAVDAKLT